MNGSLRINRLPAGLLGLLDIKSFASNPTTLAPEVRATMDLLGIYTQPTMNRIFDNAVNVPAVGQVASSLVVPTGKVWFVLQCAALSNAVLGAATTLRGRMSITDNNGAFVMVGDPQTATVGELHMMKLGAGNGFLMFPGQVIAILTESFAGVAPTYTVSVRRLEVDI